MRPLIAFFVFGLLVGGSAGTAFAAQIQGPARYGSSVNFNYPDGLEVRRRSGPIYDWPDAPNGWGNMRDVNKMSIGGRDVNIDGIRKFQPINLARSAVTLAKLAGPIGIGLTLLDLVWDEVMKQWVKPGQVGDEGALIPGKYWYSASAPGCTQAADQCSWLEATTAFRNNYGGSNPDMGDARFTSQCTLNGTAALCPFEYYYVPWESWFGGGSATFYAAGDAPPSENVPASDQDIEDSIYAELVARGMGSDLARRLIEAGYTLAPDGHEAVGPSSIPGDTSTVTTSGPAGTTTTTTNTTTNLTYNTDNTTNTTTVTVTQTTNTTTTSPDGTTTTSVDTKSPAPGETPPEEEPKAFCDLFPDASACQKLDIPQGQTVEPEEINVTFTPSGGFGSDGGTCPSPYYFIVQDRSFSVDYQPFCNFFVSVRPVVIAMAFITAMLISLGGYKRD